MFGKIKHGLAALMLAASLLCGITGCSEENNGSDGESNAAVNKKYFIY